MCCRIVVTAHFHFYFILCKKEHFNGILDEISLFSVTDSYDEFFFELPYEEPGYYKIYAEFTNSGLLIEDDWEITFPMEQVK